MYTYHKATENGMTLHIIETDASNIRPVQLLKTSNLKGSNEYGINGGWYTSTCLLYTSNEPDYTFLDNVLGRLRIREPFPYSGIHQPLIFQVKLCHEFPVIGIFYGCCE